MEVTVVDRFRFGGMCVEYAVQSVEKYRCARLVTQRDCVEREKDYFV